MLELDTSGISEIGGRQRNEDACGGWQSGTTGCWVLSDGAGGHDSGDMASRLVVSTVLEAFSHSPEVSSARALTLLQAANAAVIQHKTSGATRNDMHATACILLLDRVSRHAIFGHVGDSRIYHFSRSGILTRTRDHSLVQQMLDAGYGDDRLLRSHPGRHLLTSAIGAAGVIEITVSLQPVEVLPGDAFLLCSDGWWERLEDYAMLDLLQRQPVAARWLEVMAAAIKHGAPAGHDNYSAICVSTRDDSTLLIDAAPA